MMDKHDTIGIDLVAMSANDLIVQGAEPLFFLDYIATGKIDVDRNVAIVKGVAEGCVEAGCALIGGENAEMPGLYAEDEYDLAGFCVGVVEKNKIIDGSEVSVEDRIIGLASNGIHSNGLSLARKVLLDTLNLTVSDTIEGLENSIGFELLRPTKIYVKTIANIMRDFTVKGIAHITGGGFFENIPRSLPTRCKAVIIRNSWNIPPIFKRMQELGKIDEEEMFRTFNMGVGMIIIVAEKDSQEVIDRLGSLEQEAFIIGSITHRLENEPSVIFE
jgi:phosphoribosylformylglycinamidine cyclo-ligase